MKNKNSPKILGLVLGVILALSAPQWVMAANNYTPACTTITNTATLSYSVGGTGQPNVTSNNGSCTTGNNCAFNVGVKVNVTVVKMDMNAVTVAPGQTAVALTFSVVNNGNATMKYALTAANKADGTVNPFGGALTDNFQPTIVSTNGTAGSSGSIASLAPDAGQSVTIVADMPTTRTDAVTALADNDLAVLSLTAQSQWVGSATNVTADGTAAGTTIGGATCNALGATNVDVVVADTTAGTDDAARDGAYSDRDAYKVSSAVLTFTKTATTIWDPIHGNASPKPIPGALVQYVLTISNAGTAGSSATLTQISDTLVANLTMDADFKTPAACGAPPCTLASLANGPGGAGKGFKIQSGGTSTRASTAAVYYTTANDADGVENNAGVITANMGGAGTAVLPVEGTYAKGELKPGESVTLTFNVTIN